MDLQDLGVLIFVVLLVAGSTLGVVLLWTITRGGVR
jgi:hypothetical protein